MDMFGIGAAIGSMVEIYRRSARETGRTCSMIDNLKSGDRIIFLHPHEAQRVKRLAKEAGKEIECVSMPVGANPFERFGTGQGRTVFDHSWVEEFYAVELDNITNTINRLERELSGYGWAHLETKLAAKNIIKFNV